MLSALCGFNKEGKRFTHKTGTVSEKKRKPLPIFKLDRKGRNLNYLLISVSCKKA